MLAEFEYVDAAIGQMVTVLSKAGLLNSTTITNGTPPSGLLGPLYLPDSEINQIGATEDDISLLWLKPGADTIAAVNLIETGAAAAGAGEIFYGPSIATTYDTPGLPPNDPPTPDIIVQPNVGVVYTGSSKKQSEHGGFAQDDTNVMILVSNPKIKAATNSSFVETKQVSPTILSILGLDPGSLCCNTFGPGH